MRLFIFLIILITLCTNAFAISAEVEKKRSAVKTNKNKISGEFDTISERGLLEKSVADYRSAGISTFNNAEVSEVLKPTNNPDNLQNIDPHAMESMGRSKRGEHTFFNDFEIDYTKPGVAKHKSDIYEIITASDKKILDLTKALRKEGIDCQEEDIKAEPTSPYYIDIAKEKHKEVTYNQHFCEQPVNTYKCHDEMYIRCEIKGWTDHPWQEPPRELLFSWQDIMDHGWTRRVSWKKNRAKKLNGKKRPNRISIQMKNSPGIREEIAKRLGVHIGHIHPNLDVSGRGNGKEFNINHTDLVWATYTVRYKYRDGHEICKKWSEERWDESCVISPK